MRNDGAWRDERRLPLDRLSEAVAVSPTEAQRDDPTGGDAGAEQKYGEESRGRKGVASDGDPDPTSEEGRRARPSFDGPLGPIS